MQIINQNIVELIPRLNNVSRCVEMTYENGEGGVLCKAIFVITLFARKAPTFDGKIAELLAYWFPH